MIIGGPLLGWESDIGLPPWENEKLLAFAGQTSFNNIIITYAICTTTTYNIFIKTAQIIFKFYFKHKLKI
jgi:hypothetical protein